MELPRSLGMAWLRLPRRSRQGHSNAHASHIPVVMLVNCVSTENRTPIIHHHKSGTYTHTYIHTWIRPTAMLRCRRRDNVIEMHLRLTSLPWCWWVDNRTLIRRTTTYIHTCTWSSEQLIRPSTYIHTYIRCRKSCATSSLKCTCVSQLCYDVDEWIAATIA